MFHPSRLSSSIPLLSLMPTFGWLLCPSIKPRPSKAKGPPISIFFCQLISTPNDGQPSSPHVPTRPCLFYNAPLMSTPSLIWLLFTLIRRWPPKAKAPPPSLLFDASYFASPSKQTNNSEHNPDGSQPAHGVGEWRHHDLVAPLLYPWRERGQSRWRLGWHGSYCWLLCLRVLCFVFCAPTDDQTTVPFFRL